METSVGFIAGNNSFFWKKRTFVSSRRNLEFGKTGLKNWEPSLQEIVLSLFRLLEKCNQPEQSDDNPEMAAEFAFAVYKSPVDYRVGAETHRGRQVTV